MNNYQNHRINQIFDRHMTGITSQNVHQKIRKMARDVYRRIDPFISILALANACMILYGMGVSSM